MIGLALGHAIKHFYQQAFLLLIPSVKTYLGLNDVEIGLIATTRTVFGASINIPAGMLADIWRSKVGLLLAASLTSLALGYLIIGVTPSYWLLLLGVAITGCGASFWHAPAFGTLASAYPDRRATSFAVHRMGGSTGDSIAPLTVGLVLGGFAFWGLEWDGLHWRTLSLFLVAPAGLAALIVLMCFGNTQSDVNNRQSFATYFKSAKTMLTNSTIISMVIISGFRSMAHSSLSIFLIIYMSEDLGFSSLKIGYHVTLLTLFGIGSSPLLGWTSDRIGRRPVLVFSLACMSVLVFSLLVFGTGWSFTLILALIGLFLYSVNPIMLAAAVDATPKGTEGSGIAVMFAVPTIIGGSSPVIAGQLRQTFGMDAVFYYVATIVALVTVVSLLVPMKKT